MIQKSITIKIIAPEDADIDALERDIFELIREGATHGHADDKWGTFNFQVVIK